MDFSQDISRDEFAQHLIEAIRQSGEPHEPQYNPHDGHLRGTGPEKQVVMLANIFREYEQANPNQRATIFRNAVRTWFSSRRVLPDDYESAQPDMLPGIRARAASEFTNLRLQRDGEKKLVPVDCQVQIGEHLLLVLVYDLPEAIVTLQQRHLEDWKVSFDEAMEQALKNLRGLNPSGFERVAPGVWQSPWRDNHDGARVMLLDLLREYPVRGELVAMIPNRDTLLFTGADDEVGLGHLARLAEKALEHPRNISGGALRLVGDKWEDYQPPVGHPSHDAFRALRTCWLAGVYNSQKNLLDELAEDSGEDVYVASASVMQDKETGRRTTFSVWTEPVHSLLPETDEVFFFRQRIVDGRVGGDILARASWQRVLAVLQGRLEPLGCYPERWRGREFPTEAELEALGGGGPFRR